MASSSEDSFYNINKFTFIIDFLTNSVGHVCKIFKYLVAVELLMKELSLKGSGGIIGTLDFYLYVSLPRTYVLAGRAMLGITLLPAVITVPSAYSITKM